jgi:glycosyltransferase involved in cell wall biosynthesis
MKPKLSVIIASYNAETTIRACLESLADQIGGHPFEIIVVDSSTDKTSEIVNSHFSQVRFFNFDRRKYCGDARNIGISNAKAHIVAFIDADCQAKKNWVQEILKAHQSDSPAIGGVIDIANPNSYVGWAAYFCEFSRWMPGTQAGWMDDIAGANMSYKKDIFNKFGVFIEGTYCSDTHFHWQLSEAGHFIRFLPSIIVSHINIKQVDRFFKHEFFHGRCFARVRTQSKSFSRWQRFVFTLFSPLIPFRLLVKVAFNNLKNRVYFNQFLKSLPLLTLGIICWSMGEAVGYIEGEEC